MPKNSEVDVEVLYTTWVATGRNAAETARRLGMNGNTVRYHVMTGQFQGRYNMEFRGQAESVRKMAMIEALTKYPSMLSVLIELAQDPEQPAMARIAAVREFMRCLPEPEDDPRKKEILEAGWHPTTIGGGSGEASSLAVLEPEAVEAQIREVLEGNIVEAHEARTKKRS